jgi:hypothetical protein
MKSPNIVVNTQITIPNIPRAIQSWAIGPRDTPTAKATKIAKAMEIVMTNNTVPSVLINERRLTSSLLTFFELTAATRMSSVSS